MSWAGRVSPLVFGGVLREASRSAAVTNKFTGEEFTRVGLATREEINEAFDQAHAATLPMAAMPPHQRVEILSHLHSLLKQNANEFAELISLEAGKPIAGSKIEVDRSLITLADGIKEAGSATPDGTWRDTSSPAGRMSLLSRRFPIGVASFVTPFNFPLNLAVGQVRVASLHANECLDAQDCSRYRCWMPFRVETI